MKKILAISVIFALSACTEVAPDEAQADGVSAEAAVIDSADLPGFEAVAPGAYEIIHSDASVDQLTVHPGLTWSMVFANNDIAGGTIYAQDGRSCFVTEGVDEHQCFDDGPFADDGSMEVTSDGGEVMTVRPVEAEEAAE